MKLTKFFTESILTDCFRPRLKNGSEKRKMSYEYQLKKDLAEYQNQWQSDENTKDRLWQEFQWQQQFNQQQKEWLRQFELQNAEWVNRFSQENSEWSRRFNAENDYNDPSAQIARLQKAGLNPTAFMGGDAAGLSSAPTVQSTPSVGSPVAPSPSPSGTHQFSPSPLPNFGSVSSTPQMFTSLAALNDALAKTAQTGLNVERQKALLDAEFGAVMAKADSDRSAAVFTSIKAGIEQMHGSDKMKSEIELNLMRSYLANMQGDKETALKHYNEAMSHFVQTQDKYLQDASPELINNLVYLGKLYKAQEATEREKPAVMQSQISLNYAKAAEANSQSAYLDAIKQTEDALRQGRITGQTLSNDIAGIQKMIIGRENEIQGSFKEEMIHSFVATLERNSLINEELSQRIRKAASDADWADVEHMLGIASQTISTASGAVGALSAVQRNAIKQQQLNLMKQGREFEWYNSANDTYVTGWSRPMQ